MIPESLPMIEALGRPFHVVVGPPLPDGCGLVWLVGPQSGAQLPRGDRVAGPRLVLHRAGHGSPWPQVEGDVHVVSFHPGEVNEAFFQTPLGEPPPRSALNDHYLLEPFLEPEPEGIFLGAPAAQRLGEVVRSLEAELAGKPDGYWPCRTRSYLLELLLFVRFLRTASPPSLVERVRTYLHSAYAQTIRLQPLARMFGTNRTTLARQFRGATGKTVVEYLNELRVQVAADLLRDTTLPIVEILDRVGIGDPSQFGRLFRSAMGRTPTEYRKAENWIFPHFH